MSRPSSASAVSIRSMLTFVCCGVAAGMSGVVAYRFFNAGVVYGLWGIAAAVTIILMFGAVADRLRDRAARRPAAPARGGGDW